MKHTISRLQLWLLRKIVRSNIVQGPYHTNNMVIIQQVIVEEATKEFSEDNAATLYYFLSETMENGFKRAWPSVDNIAPLRKNWANFHHID